jgi:hypothetical protein
MEENKNAGSINPPAEIQSTADLRIATEAQKHGDEVKAQEAAKVVDPSLVETGKLVRNASSGEIAAADQALAKMAEKGVEKFEAENQTFLMATNPYMMGKAQSRLIDWAKRKLAELHVELKDHQGNLAIAVKRKIRTEAYKRYIVTTTKKIEFQEKVLAALEAGFCIVPDMDVELFAVRTTRRKPQRKIQTNRREEGNQWPSHPDIPDVHTNSPPKGEGQFVDVRPFRREDSTAYTDSKTGKAMIRQDVWASKFDPLIDFPFKLAKPAILDQTTKAMALKIFDEIGVLPKSRIQPDPVIVGRITRRVNSFTQQRFNFLIAWFLDTKDL